MGLVLPLKAPTLLLMKKYLFLIVFSFVVACATSSAQTINATTCSTTDVQTALNTVTLDGTTVNVPPGTCTWTVPVCPVNIGAGTCASPAGSPVGHSINLVGAGSNLTHIIVNIPSGFGGDAFFVGNRESDGKAFRVTGFDWQYESADAGGILTFTQSTGYSIRIDHNTAEPYSLNPGYGRFVSMGVPCVYPGCLIDHNTVISLGNIVEAVSPGDVLPGDAVWQQPAPFENINAVYFEFNTFSDPTFLTHQVDMVDCDDGGAYVFRDNTITQNPIGNHGNDSTPNGCRLEDAYRNTIDPQGISPWGVQYRGGPGVIWNNIWLSNATNQNFGVTDYRSANGSGNPTAHGFCNGSNAIDQNSSPTGTFEGWRCCEQAGQGPPSTCNLSGGGGSGGTFTDLPIYEWGNCKTALGCTVGGASQVTVQVYTAFPSGATFDWTTTHIKQNRDYYDQVSGFTGATGVGMGALTSRPATCTTGTFYFATDAGPQGIGYKCISTNHWDNYYIPFTSPHPLSIASSFILPFFCIDMNSSNQWPDGVTNDLVTFDCVRIWDTPGAEWSYIETSQGVYNFSTLDTVLANAYANGVYKAQMPLNRTPLFYTSNTGDTTCGYYVPIGTGTLSTAGTSVTRNSGTTFLNTWTSIIIGTTSPMGSTGVLYQIASFIDGSHLTLVSGPPTPQTAVAFSTPSSTPNQTQGQCDMPTDVNIDGSGTDLAYKNWVAALYTHLNAGCPGISCYWNTHAHMVAAEFYNEPDVCKFLNTSPSMQASCTGTATNDQMGRWIWDANCIIDDIAGTNPWVPGQTCAQARALVTSVSLTGPIDPSVVVLMGSYHGATFSYNLAQNFLYCNHAPVPPHCSHGSAAYTKGVNFHFKYAGFPAVQGDATTVLEAAVDTWNRQLQAILQPAELLKPIVNTEGGAAAGGWTDCATTFAGPPFCNYTDPDMEMSYMARNLILQQWEGIVLNQPIANAVWYDCGYATTPAPQLCLGAAIVGSSSSKPNKAYNQTIKWIKGLSNLSCGTSAPGTTKTGLFTWMCTFIGSDGRAKAIIWDNSQGCSGGSCSTTNQTVSSQYISYSDLDGNAPVNISGPIPIGVKPILLNASINPPSALTVLGVGY